MSRGTRHPGGEGEGSEDKGGLAALLGVGKQLDSGELSCHPSALMGQDTGAKDFVLGGRPWDFESE